jgi:hypothetical protein
MVYLNTKNYNFGKFWKALKCKFLVYFTAIWFTTWTFGIFFLFWYVVPRKNLATL